MNPDTPNSQGKRIPQGLNLRHVAVSLMVLLFMLLRTGKWTIFSGEGVNLADENNPNTTERSSWSSSYSAGAFASLLKLPVAGYRVFSYGSIINVGIIGLYWFSTVDGTYSRSLDFNSSNANMNSNNRAVGFSVRCLKD